MEQDFLTNEEFLEILGNSKMKKVRKYIKKGEYITYYNIPFGFDIETTSTEVEGEKFAFMYLWAIGALIDNKPYITYGRTWKEFEELIDKMKEKLKLSDDLRIVCYIHNQSYEFQFMCKYFEFTEVFATDDRNPISANIKGIEFKDSYILSGLSLEKTAKNLVKHDIKKMVGDLDYNLIRTHETHLSKLELNYQYNDVYIVLCYIDEMIIRYDTVYKIPKTNTGKVRLFCKKKCLGKSSYRYRELMKDLTLTVPIYKQLHSCFMGGFTHASLLHAGKKLENVSSYDFTSSYPYVMLSEKYPMTTAQYIENVSRETFFKMVNNDNLGFMCVAKFTNIRSRITYESYLSENKCKLVGGMLNNGRVMMADECVVNITNIDYDIISNCYTWDKMEISKFYWYKMEYLPKQLVECIIEMYKDKTTLKGVEGMEAEYLLKKGMLNSCYGMSVQAVLRDIIDYDEEWSMRGLTEEEEKEEINKYNQSNKRFLYYPWGVWVTAYARRNLWSGIFAIGDDYVYSDTDSIKLLNVDTHKEYFENYDAEVKQKLEKMCNYHNFSLSELSPKTKEGKEKIIGVWDYEGNYEYFKTLGAKRYMCTMNRINHITVAGLPKKKGMEYIERIAEERGLDVYEVFNDGMMVPDKETGKLTHTYIDKSMSGMITDYLGNSVLCESRSSVHLSSCSFEMSLADEYLDLLQEVDKGRITKEIAEI